jgi:hypothetical protein
MKKAAALCLLLFGCPLLVYALPQKNSDTSSPESLDSTPILEIKVDSSTGKGTGYLKVGPLTLKVTASTNHLILDLKPKAVATGTTTPPSISPAPSSAQRFPNAEALGDAARSSSLNPSSIQPVPSTSGETQLLLTGPPANFSETRRNTLEAQSKQSPDESKSLDPLIQHLIQQTLLSIQELKFIPLYDLTFSLQGDPGGPPDILDFPEDDQELSSPELPPETEELEDLANACVTVTLFRADGTSVILTRPTVQSASLLLPCQNAAPAAFLGSAPTATVLYDDAPIVLIQVDGIPRADYQCQYISDFIEFGPLFEQTCQVQYLIARTAEPGSLPRLLPAMGLGGTLSDPVLLVRSDFSDSDPSSLYAVNGDPKIINEQHQLTIPSPDDTWSVDWQRKTDGCRGVPADPQNYSTLVLKTRIPPARHITNGIAVGSPKVFDVTSLQRMLNTTANQLASISGFNASSINAAFGNFQGITRSTSYLNAQVSTALTPAISQQTGQTVNTPNTTQTTTPTGSTTVTLQCPDGTLPSIGSGSSLGGCTVVPVSGTTANVPAYSTVGPSNAASQGVLTTNAAGSTVSNTGSTTNTQNQTTTSTPSVSGVVPQALTATPLNPPTNVGVSSLDLLAEQVQLNSQITVLQLLLQGALSDEYLLKNSKAIAKRQQTTLGFNIALDPPRQFKHAVAEVHVVLVPSVPTEGAEGPSIMNLLPSEKTYNVAKVTSHQNSFGAGAVVEPISFGVSNGKSKDRLYLAKDTDTLALQFPLPVRGDETERPGRPFPQYLHDVLKSVGEFQTIDECDWNSGDGSSSESAFAKARLDRDISRAVSNGAQPIAFGWQFRPVLGADYVRGGDRQVFAQLALDAGLNANYRPHIYIETVWREYNPQRQVVGEVYKDSCSLARQSARAVSILVPPLVRNVTLTDLGAGQVKLSATGDFFSSSLSVLSSQNTLSSLFFDGNALEAFANARDLLEAGDLRIVGQNGQNSPFAIPTKRDPLKQCGITQARLRAAPRPDGNSKVYLELTLGSTFFPTETQDGSPNPLVLLGGQVYGLRETPFLTNTCLKNNPLGQAVCHYEFLAPTTGVRNAQNFLARDLTWDAFSREGITEFLPSFTSLKVLASPAAPVITRQPENREVAPGAAVDFSVVAESTPPQPLTYQWLKDGEPIPGGTGPSFQVPAAQVNAANSGDHFAVRVSNFAGTTVSNSGVLTVDNPIVNPVIMRQPSDQKAQPGQRPVFSVAVKGTEPLTFQWRKGGALIPGATGLSVTLPPVALGDNGAQIVATVSHAGPGAATATSQAAILTVATGSANIPPAPQPADAKPVAYEISGFDFRRFVGPGPCGNSFESPCLSIYADSMSMPFSAFTVVSDNLATIQNVPAGTKNLWFKVAFDPVSQPPLNPGAANTVVWELAIPKATDDTVASVVGSPAFLYVNDTQNVSFISPAFSVFETSPNNIPISFNGGVITGTYDTKKKALTVLITTNMTNTPGHKEMSVTVPAAQGSGIPQPMKLTFDVIRQIIKE